MTPAMAQSLESRPTVVDFREESPWVQLAKAHWLNTKVRKAKPDVIKKQLWDPLEAEAFNSRSLLILENLNILEKYVLSSHACRANADLTVLQVSLADLHRGCVKSSCTVDCIDCQREASRALTDMA